MLVFCSQADVEKDKGNVAFKAGKFNEAVMRYTDAIAICPLSARSKQSVYYRYTYLYIYMYSHTYNVHVSVCMHVYGCGWGRCIIIVHHHILSSSLNIAIEQRAICVPMSLGGPSMTAIERFALIHPPGSKSNGEGHEHSKN